MLRLAFLGTYRVDADGEPLRWRSRKSIALLSLLALAPERCSKEWLAGLLWPDGTRTQARVNLRNLIFHTRRSLGPSSIALEDRGESFGLTPSAFDCDVSEFLDLAGRTEASKEALELYRGELFAGFDLPGNDLFGEWLGDRRAQLHQTLLRAIRKAYDRARIANNAADALALARRWVGEEAFDEQGRRALMRSLVRAGDRAGAIAAYRDWQQIVARELGTTPDPATVALAQRLAPDQRRSRPLPKTAPLFRPALIGRDHDLAWLERESADADQPLLLLLCGESGLGRTRLLIEYCDLMLSRNNVVLLGQTPPEAAMPFQGLSQAVRSWLNVASGSPARVLSGVAAVDLAELARLAPEIRRYEPDLPSPLPGWPPEVDRRLTLVLGTVLQSIARQAAGEKRRFVLCLDDLDLSSDATLHALMAFFTDASIHPAPLVVATVRDEETPAVRDWLRELRRLVPVRERRLEALSADDNARLLQSMAGVGPQPILPALASFVYERSGGVPLFTVELTRLLFDQELLHIDGGGVWELTPPVGGRGPALPASLEDALRQRLNRLSDETYRLLIAASSLAQPFSSRELISRNTFSARAVSVMLEELIARRFLSCSDDGYRFNLGLVRDLLKSDLGGRRQ